MCFWILYKQYTAPTFYTSQGFHRKTIANHIQGSTIEHEAQAPHGLRTLYTVCDKCHVCNPSMQIQNRKRVPSISTNTMKQKNIDNYFSHGSPTQDRDFVEVFSGAGEITRALRSVTCHPPPKKKEFQLTIYKMYFNSSPLYFPALNTSGPQITSASNQANLRGAAIDIDLTVGNVFDLTRPAAFAFLGF